MFFSRPVPDMVTAEAALAGRDQPIVDPAPHFVSQRPLVAPFPDGHQQIIVAMGCFWGAERIMWQTPGVWVTAVGYSGGFTPNPTYEETCSGRTGHTEAVLVDFDPKTVSLEGLMQVFWESHDPTQLFRQGNDVGTQYRSAVYWTDEAQQIWQEQGYRSVNPQLLDKQKFPVPDDLFTIKEFGGWDKVADEFFGDGTGSVFEIVQDLGYSTE